MSDQLSKDDILGLIRGDHARLESTLAGLTETQMTQPGVSGTWSVKDILAHITFWEQRMLYRLACARRGEQPGSLMHEGEEQSAAIERINAQVFEENSHRPLDEVRADFQRSFQQVLATLESLSEADLADQRLSQLLGVPVIEQLAGDSYEHYQEHDEMIRAWLGGAIDAAR
jgi:hypothetical protein